MPSYKRVKSALAYLFLFSGIFLLLILYLPVIKVYLPHQNAQAEVLDEPFSIYIPKIGAASKVIENVDPNNEQVYRAALKQGVAHAKGSHLPGGHGTIYLFAHSSDSPWNISRYNTIFFRLGELQPSDIIEIRKDNNTYKYLVTDKKEVWPNEVEYITQSKDDQLILQTCTPIGTSLKRLLVFAKPI